MVGKDGILVNPGKNRCGEGLIRLASVSEVRNFSGLIGYYRRLVEGFSKSALPLTGLIRKSMRFTWSNRCESSFQELKQRLIKAPVLSLPKDKGKFVIHPRWVLDVC